MLVLRQEPARAGVPWREQAVHRDDLASFDGAFVSNSRGVAAVALVDDVPLPADAELVRTVTDLAGPYGHGPGWSVRSRACTRPRPGTPSGTDGW
ncbi:hypothetical protein [Streptomyces paromomycinus]|uniref:hypothetical protein n=1 Tax=Streptomyces paromomycinus TaxID=92743 RepID=UPI000F627C76|nr:hypothetical protein [Streptomyces paromomycinus]